MNEILILTGKRIKAKRDADDATLAYARRLNGKEAHPKKANRTPNFSRK